MRELPKRLLKGISSLFTSRSDSVDGPRIDPTSYGAVSDTPRRSPATTTTKVEPKVFLACERTFLSWLRAAVLIGSFSIALFNASSHSFEGRLVGFIYVIVSISIATYAWFMFQLRIKRIVARWPGHFDEIYGPIALCVALFTGVLINFILRVTNRSEPLTTPKNPWLASTLSRFVVLQDSLIQPVFEPM